jgi:hypothetical protein
MVTLGGRGIRYQLDQLGRRARPSVTFFIAKAYTEARKWALVTNALPHVCPYAGSIEGNRVHSSRSRENELGTSDEG